MSGCSVGGKLSQSERLAYFHVAGLSELTIEQLQDVHNQIVQVSKRRNDLMSVYGITTTVEDYLWGDVGLHFHATIRVALDSASLCAIFQRHPLCDFNVAYLRSPSTVVGVTTERQSSQPNSARKKTGDLNEPMFIGVVYLMKNPKDRVSMPIPSMVWLQTSNDCPVLFPKVDTTVCTPSVTSFATTSWAVELDRKTDFSGIYLRVVQEGQLASQQIQGRPQVVNNLADDYRPLQGNPVVMLGLKAQDIISGVAVSLRNNNTIAVSLDRSVNGVIERLDLLGCPIRLRKRPIERMHGPDGS